MKYSVLFYFLVALLTFQSCGNRLNNWRYVDRCLECKKNKSLTVEQRNEEYQFKNSSKIAYVSFPETRNMNIERYFESLIQNPSLFNVNDFHEIKFLNIDEINKLSDLIYNYGFRKNINGITESTCYYPNNAILFLKNDNSLLGYIEICFDCNKYSTSTENFTLGEQCDNKIHLLKNLFIEEGITYVSSIIERPSPVKK